VIQEDLLKTLADEKQVSDGEFQVLSLAMKGESTPTIAAKVEISEDLVRKRLSDIYKKFDIPGRGPVKLAKLQQHLLALSRGQLPDSSSLDIEGEPRRDWGEAPDVSIFYGRSEQLDTLAGWVLNDHCRLVAICGMGGIGKTTLAIKLAKQIQDQFDGVIWRSLRDAPPARELLADLIKFFAPGVSPPYETDDRISRLMDALKAKRCLIVLDSAQAILKSGDLAGHYSDSYQDYGNFIKRVATESHQSCLVITSLEQIDDIALLQGETMPVRVMELRELDEEQAWEIFRAKGLSEPEQWVELTNLYRGNPLALKIVATTIKELFGGNVSEFLKQKTFVFGNIRDLLEFQFERLYKFEKEILYWLAIERQPVTFFTLQEDIELSEHQDELLEALESLGRRNLIEKMTETGSARFSLQPMVLEYVTNQLVVQAGNEIMEAVKTQDAEKLHLLRSHNLVKGALGVSGSGSPLENPILQPINDRLCKAFRSQKKVEERYNRLLSWLGDRSLFEIGYAADNIQSLIEALPPDPAGNSLAS